MTSDLSKCINCFRCVRACDEVQGFVPNMAGQGFDSHIIKGSDVSFKESDCGCGACAQAYPTPPSVMCLNQNQLLFDTKQERFEQNLLWRGLQPGCSSEGWKNKNHTGSL